MVKLKNYNVSLKHFVLILTFGIFFSCAEKKFHITKIEGKKIEIENTISESAKIENFIKPYRDNINNDLNMVLAIAPITLDKNGQWQTPMGNFMSDSTLELTNPVFQKKKTNRLTFVCSITAESAR